MMVLSNKEIPLAKGCGSAEGTTSVGPWKPDMHLALSAAEMRTNHGEHGRLSVTPLTTALMLGTAEMQTKCRRGRGSVGRSRFCKVVLTFLEILPGRRVNVDATLQPPTT